MAEHYDGIVVGSGAGGTLTRPLAPAGKGILLPALTARVGALLDAMHCHNEVIDRSTHLCGRLGISRVAHQNGTVRFGSDPATSALEVNCKLYEVDNLYVVPSSFLVSSAAMNLPYTMIANDLRVADHLKQRFGVRAKAAEATR
jgi:choline dehydrogenase-like flavoprotein